MRGKNAIVTGASRGIGKAILKKLVQSGVNVWACMRKKDEELEEEFQKFAEENDVWIKPVYMDLSSEESVKNAAKEILSEKRKIDILVNNAGIAFAGTLSMTPMSRVRETFEVNFFAMLALIQMISKQMIRNKDGNIVNIGSVSGLENYGGNISYGSSKAAVIWATKELSKELSIFGIRVNSVSPGTTHTDMNQVRNNKQMEEVMSRTTLKRMAEPEEIANAVLFLVSEEASYITGHNLVVDGGRLN